MISKAKLEACKEPSFTPPKRRNHNCAIVLELSYSVEQRECFFRWDKQEAVLGYHRSTVRIFVVVVVYASRLSSRRVGRNVGKRNVAIVFQEFGTFLLRRDSWYSVAIAQEKGVHVCGDEFSASFIFVFCHKVCNTKGRQPDT